MELAGLSQGSTLADYEKQESSCFDFVKNLTAAAKVNWYNPAESDVDRNPVEYPGLTFPVNGINLWLKAFAETWPVMSCGATRAACDCLHRFDASASTSFSPKSLPAFEPKYQPAKAEGIQCSFCEGGSEIQFCPAS